MNMTARSGVWVKGARRMRVSVRVGLAWISESERVSEFEEGWEEQRQEARSSRRSL